MDYLVDRGIFSVILICSSGDDEGILPTWTAVDASSVLTSREVWEKLRNDGWGVEVRVSCPQKRG